MTRSLSVALDSAAGGRDEPRLAVIAMAAELAGADAVRAARRRS